MNVFDESVITFLNHFSNKYILFDYFLNYLSGNMLWKGGIPIAMFWVAWYTNTNQKKNRVYTLTSFFSCVVSIFIARVLALTLPFRYRPMHNPDIDFQLPYSLPPRDLDGWSSFPSDHATYFFAMATGLYFISKKIGMLMYIYVLLVICFPRVYLGMHYPTDIIAGAMIGIAITWIFNSVDIRNKLTKSTLILEKKSPKVFYPFFFLLSFEMANMFNNIRDFGTDLSELLEQLF